MKNLNLLKMASAVMGSAFIVYALHLGFFDFSGRKIDVAPPNEKTNTALPNDQVERADNSEPLANKQTNETLHKKVYITYDKVEGKRKSDDKPASPFSSRYHSEVSGITPYEISNGDYASYPLDQLFKMAENGDILAMQIAGIRLIAEEGDSKRAKYFLEKAIIHGAKHYPFSILAEQASLKLRLEKKGRISLSKKERIDHIISTFSYYELSAKMGNSDLKKYFYSYYKNHYNISPTSSEEKEIQKKADKMYSSIQSKRKEEGIF